MDHFDLSKKPKEELEFLYNGLEKLTSFYLNYRDIDHDGIFENQNAIETGWEDGSYQRLGFPLACPDMNAYLALQEEALARLGRMLGKEEAINAAWEKKSKDTVSKIIEMFWTEDGWVAMNAVTKQKSEPTSLPLFCALLLGKRLPQHIIDRSIELIFDSGDFDTPYGLASEKLESPFFHHGWCSGSIGTPVQGLLALALDDCGRPDLAKQIAVKYLDTIMENGLYHIHNPFDGKQEYQSGMFFGEQSMFFSGWTAGCYLFFAEHYAR
jgi:neutral trehalase